MLFCIDVVCQVAIAVIGLSSTYLLTRNNRWGSVVGISQQPFWFFTTIYHGQWGIFLLSCVYLVVWAQGIYRSFFQKSSPPS